MGFEGIMLSEINQRKTNMDGLSLLLKNDFIFFIFFLILYIFLTVVGLHCCLRALSSCGKWRLLFIVVLRLHIVIVVERGL